MANNVVQAVEKVAKAIEQSAVLPVPTVADAGKVLGVGDDGKWALISQSSAAAETTPSSDSGGSGSGG